MLSQASFQDEIQKNFVKADVFFQTLNIISISQSPLMDVSSIFKKKLKSLKAGVNFINILHKTFSYKSILRSYSLISVWLCNFWHKNIDEKAACKMLMKLTTGVDLTNMLTCSF